MHDLVKDSHRFTLARNKIPFRVLSSCIAVLLVSAAETIALLFKEGIQSQITEKQKSVLLFYAF